jgi:hypothetical protein
MLGLFITEGGRNMAKKEQKPAKLRVKSQTKPKKATVPKEQAQKFLAKVPEENVFWCCDGCIFRDMRELAEGLDAMSDQTYSYHRNEEKKDFTNWVMNVIGDTELANDLANLLDRNEAARVVATRITILSKM